MLPAAVAPVAKAPAKVTAKTAARRRRQPLVLLACLALAACGGGGGGGSTAGATPAASPATTNTPAPTPTPEPTPTPVASVTISATPASVVPGQAVTIDWRAQNTGAASCQASGDWSGAQASSGSTVIGASAPAAGFGGAASAILSYTLTCGATSASASVTVVAPPPSNQVAVSVDAGPAGAGNRVNLPYVSVTVCRPGSTVCATIDHVLVDTGSYGLRLLAPAAAALALPPVLAPSGAAAGECGQFVSGYTWGSVVQADVRLGGESAGALSLQLIGDAPGGSASAPAACSNVGANIGTLAALGANGILGIGLLRQDCGAACAASAIAATYYSCANGSCSSSRMPLAQQVSNPVASFAVNNNGAVLQLPAVAAGGQASLAGTLTFGIGTDANNGIGGETVFRANASGNFTTIYKGVTMSASFIDSGSNGIFFNDSGIAGCSLSTGFYCPASSLILNATTVAADGSASAAIAFRVDSADVLGGVIHAAHLGGSAGAIHAGANNAFDWGLPFFFGRRVFMGLEQGSTRGYWAY